jgi:hypothetical protein
LGQRVLVFDLHHEVADVCLNIAADLWSEVGTHGLLESGPDVHRAKGHAGLTVTNFKHDKYNLYFVFCSHLDLMVPLERIEEVEQITTHL